MQFPLYDDGRPKGQLTAIHFCLADHGFREGPPDGQTIAFNSKAAIGGTDAALLNSVENIWSVSEDGTHLTSLTNVTASFADCSNPVWSPDVKKIAFFSARNIDGSDSLSAQFNTNIWVMSSDGTGISALTKFTAALVNSLAPDWSPDSAQIAFASTAAIDGSDAPTEHDTSNIWTVNSNGASPKPTTTLTSANSSSNEPHWSADDSTIFYRSLRSLDGTDAGNSQCENVWRIDAADLTGLPLTHLSAATNLSVSNLRPSADGLTVLFLSPQDVAIGDELSANFTFNVWLALTNGGSSSAVTRLTASGSSVSAAAW